MVQSAKCLIAGCLAVALCGASPLSANPFAAPDRAGAAVEDYAALLTPADVDWPKLIQNDAPEVCEPFLAAYRRAYRGSSRDIVFSDGLEGWDVENLTARAFAEPAGDDALVRLEAEGPLHLKSVMLPIDLDGDGTDEALVFDAAPPSWRGSVYPLWIIPSDGFEAAIPLVRTVLPWSRRDDPFSESSTSVGTDPTPPVVFRTEGGAVYANRRTRRVGHSEPELLHLTPTGAVPVCKVSMTPDAGTLDFDDLLAALRASQGEDHCGGTMRALSRTQLAAQLAFKTLAARPWAMRPPYNSRERLTSALETWSMWDPWSRRIYLEIVAAYPKAVRITEARLADTHPGLSDEDRAWLAEEMVWRLLGAHYVFRSTPLNPDLDESDDMMYALYSGRFPANDLERAFAEEEVDPAARRYLFAVLDQPAHLEALLALGVDPDTADVSEKTALM